MSTIIPLISTSRFSLPVARPGTGVWIDGIYEQNSGSTFTIIANAQPLNSDEMLLLPEAIRSRESIKFYTAIRMETANENTLQRADVVTYDGKQFEVFQIFRYLGQHLSHNKAICYRLDAGT